MTPDYIPPFIGIPIAVVLMIVFVVWTIRDRRKERK